MTATSNSTNLDLAHVVYRGFSRQLNTSAYDNRLLAYSHAVVQAMTRLKESIDYQAVINNAADVEPLLFKYLSMLAKRQQGPKGRLPLEQALNPNHGLAVISASMDRKGQHLYTQNPHYRNHSRRVIALKIFCRKKAVLDSVSHNLCKLLELDQTNYLRIKNSLLELVTVEPGQVLSAV